MKWWLLALTLGIVFAVGIPPSTLSAQEGPATEPTVTAEAEANDAPAESTGEVAAGDTAPASTDSSSPASAPSKGKDVASGLPKWLVLFGKGWPIILTLLLTVVVAKVIKDEGWKSIVAKIVHAVDATYLAYVQPAKDPNNPLVEWDPAEARARAWAEAKKQAGPILKLIFALKGKAWGETLVHRIANARSKGKKSNGDSISTS